jgi:membrane protein
MTRARSELADDLLLIAATAILVLTAQRYLRRDQVLLPGPDPRLPVAPQVTFARELSERAPGRRSGNPLQIPWAGWTDILWRTYQRNNDDRLLATAGGVVFFGLLAVFPAITALVSSMACSPTPRPSGRICTRWR